LELAVLYVHDAWEGVRMPSELHELEARLEGLRDSL
jgi:hypothetical protein